MDEGTKAVLGGLLGMIIGIPLSLWLADYLVWRGGARRLLRKLRDGIDAAR